MPTLVYEVTEASIRILAQQLPASPRVFAKVQAALQREATGVTEIVDLVKVDAGLCAALLRVANSPFYQRGERIESINAAINRVGLRKVHRMLGLALAQQVLRGGLACYGLSADLVWENSVVVALAATALAREAGGDDRAAYTLGLLRSVGMTVLQVVAMGDELPTLHERCGSGRETLAWERATFGMTSAMATGVLLRGWGFSDEWSAAAVHHVDPRQAPQPTALTALLHVANALAELLGKGLPCEAGNWSLDDAILRQARVKPDQALALIPDIHAEYMQLRAGLA